MRIYFPIAKVDADRREVWGYASTEARDDQGEVVKREALTIALGDYMKFANIREMHQLSAVGVAKEAGIDDKGLYIGAKIVDDRAWLKVIEGVYKGYSIGGRVTRRDPADYKTITGLVLNEISLVDRPANPEAVFDYWKAAEGTARSETGFNPPLQIWACGELQHRHVTKADALRCLEKSAPAEIIDAAAELTGAPEKSMTQAEEACAFAPSIRDTAPNGAVEYADPGDQRDGKKRYPIDTEHHIRAAWNFINRPKNGRRYSMVQLSRIKDRIIGAWKDKIGESGPPSAAGEKAQQDLSTAALRKALSDTGHIARIILDLEWLKEMLAVAAAMEGDISPKPGQIETVIAGLYDLLRGLVAEETSEVFDGTEVGEPLTAASAAGVLAMAAGVAGATLVADLCSSSGGWRMQQLADVIRAKAEHAQSDRDLLDLARQTVDKCLEGRELSVEERTRMQAARDALKAACIETNKEWAIAIAGDPEAKPELSDCDHRGENASTPTSTSVIYLIATALGKLGKARQALLDIAHDCIGTLTGGACCSRIKAGARHSGVTMAHLVEAHGHLVSAGAACDAKFDDRSGLEKTSRGVPCDHGKAGDMDNIVQALVDERAEKATLMTTLADILPRLDQLRKRVEDIAQMPLPPVTIAKGATTISKLQDNGGLDTEVTSDEVAAAFARMSREEQTLTLIKASYARPIRPLGLGTAPPSDE